MRKFTKVTLIIFIFLCYIWKIEAIYKEDKAVHYMDFGDWIDNDKPGLQIFCHNAKSKYIIHIWKTVTMQLKTNLDTYEIYEGTTPIEVAEKHDENQKYWRFSMFGIKKNKNFQLNPFEDSCIGVYMQKNKNQYEYRMQLSHNSVDTWKLAFMALGIFFFWNAQKLSRNTLFYYISGVTIGVTLSILILIYLFGKILPSGKFMYIMVASGYAMSFYLAQMMWENAQVIAMQYTDYVTYYILGTSFISFIVCYRFGPITNTRTKNIIQWILQITSLLVVYYSSYLREASLAICLILVVLYNFPVIFIRKGRKYWNDIFPAQRKLLTEDEFRKEGIIETKKALGGLKEYCSSPDCKPWKTVLKLKDPIRFAKFMEGECHLSENETMDHDMELTKLIEECDYTDDEDNEDD